MHNSVKLILLRKYVQYKCVIQVLMILRDKWRRFFLNPRKNNIVVCIVVFCISVITRFGPELRHLSRQVETTDCQNHRQKKCLWTDYLNKWTNLIGYTMLLVPFPSVLTIWRIYNPFSCSKLFCLKDKQTSTSFVRISTCFLCTHDNNR